MGSLSKVAPHTGAWIETLPRLQVRCIPASLPIRERGLKPIVSTATLIKSASLPIRERGLKLPNRHCAGGYNHVAPHTGAWIETIVENNLLPVEGVAPHTGAWIETGLSDGTQCGLWSLPIRERGLKHGCQNRNLNLFSRSPYGSVD